MHDKNIFLIENRKLQKYFIRNILFCQAVRFYYILQKKYFIVAYAKNFYSVKQN